jgi:hypothetical protein
LFGKSKRKRSLKKPAHTCEDMITMDFCEHDNEHFGCIKAKTLLTGSVNFSSRLLYHGVSIKAKDVYTI